VVCIKGLGDFNQSDLVKAENILEGYYNIQCTIDGSIDLNNEFYNSNGLKCSEALDHLEISGKKVFYITNEKLTLNEEYPHVRGCAAGNGTTAIVSTQTLKRTLIHEYAHLSGLDHCTTDNCALEITKGNGDELCSKCESKIKK
jgi:predicted Zn-dependent protease